MHAQQHKAFPARAMTAAVRGALLAMVALPVAGLAADVAGAGTGTPLDLGSEAVQDLVRPTNTVEVGLANTSDASRKFGEYNGLDKQGGHLLLNFGIRGGDAYGTQAGTMRWDIRGEDLGSTSRGLDGSLGKQGSWRLGIGYDELRHNFSDTYQSPFQGAMGGNSFTLPPSFGVINTTAPGARGLTANQQASLQTKDVHSDLKNGVFTAQYNFGPRWDVQFEFNRQEQSGARLLGLGGDKFTSGGSALSWIGQTPMVLMNPTDYTTNNWTLAANWIDERAQLTASYVGSMFRNGYDRLTWNNPFVSAGSATGTVPGAFPVDTTSTLPGNDMHQLNLTGAYRLGATTKLAGGLSYSRNTQNDAYVPMATYNSALLPRSSLDGRVMTTHADLKLSDQTTKNLLLSAELKYNQRDNRTASNAYRFWDINQTPTLANANANSSLSVNTPMSHRRTQFELAGDYRVDNDQKLRLTYEHEQIRRWCNNDAANNAQGVINAQSAVPAGWYVTATCVQVPESKEDKLAASYRLRAGDTVNLNAGYAYAKRKADVSPSFYNPIQTRSGDPATPDAAAPHAEGFNVLGYLAYFHAPRTEHRLKAGADWQASEAPKFTLSGRLTDDKYDASYGVQKGRSASLNLDASYDLDEDSSLYGYVTDQDFRRDMTNVGAIDAAFAPTMTWQNRLHERDFTAGFGFRIGGLQGDRLTINGELTYSLGRTDYGTDGTYIGTPPATPCTAATVLTCGDLPTIRNEMTQFRLAGAYRVDRAHTVSVGYAFQDLKSSDFMYNGYQFGFTPTSLLPTNEQAAHYRVHTLFATLTFAFR